MPRGRPPKPLAEKLLAGDPGKRLTAAQKRAFDTGHHPVQRAKPLTIPKAHLNVFHTDDDDLIERLIEAAVSFVEGPHGAGVALLTQTWRQSFGPRDDLRIGLYPVAEILTVEIDGEATESFTADLDQSPVTIHLDASPRWPRLPERR